jgi:hypothetical protein
VRRVPSKHCMRWPESSLAKIRKVTVCDSLRASQTVTARGSVRRSIGPASSNGSVENRCAKGIQVMISCSYSLLYDCIDLIDVCFLSVNTIYEMRELIDTESKPASQASQVIMHQPHAHRSLPACRRHPLHCAA